MPQNNSVYGVRARNVSLISRACLSKNYEFFFVNQSLILSAYCVNIKRVKAGLGLTQTFRMESRECEPGWAGEASVLYETLSCINCHKVEKPIPG